MVYYYVDVVNLKKQMFIQSADGESLDKHAAAYGLTRLSGTKARGNVWFSLTQTLETDVIAPISAKANNNAANIPDIIMGEGIFVKNIGDKVKLYDQIWAEIK